VKRTFCRFYRHWSVTSRCSMDHANINYAHIIAYKTSPLSNRRQSRTRNARLPPCNLASPSAVIVDIWSCKQAWPLTLDLWPLTRAAIVKCFNSNSGGVRLKRTIDPEYWTRMMNWWLSGVFKWTVTDVLQSTQLQSIHQKHFVCSL